MIVALLALVEEHGFLYILGDASDEAICPQVIGAARFAGETGSATVVGFG